jgi:uncharacterized protein YcgL (UPF0745 family)
MKRRLSALKCTVLRSSLRAFTYIYLRVGHDYTDLPAPLKKVFGEPEFVMDLDLSPERKLALEDVDKVMQNLSDQGYHLQLPPQEDATGLLQLPAREKTLFYSKRKEAD